MVDRRKLARTLIRAGVSTLSLVSAAAHAGAWPVGGTVAAGAVTGSGSNTGGFAGQSAGTLANDTACGATVTGTVNVGWLVGAMNGGGIAYSAASDTVTTSTSGSAAQAIGGLVGAQSGGNINESYATGNVTSNGYYIGGLVGSLTASTFSDSDVYATGSVGAAGATDVGGLVGRMTGGSVTQAYAAGLVSGSKAGGLVGLQSGGAITGAVWDTTATHQTTGVASHTAGTFTAIGYTTMQLQNPANTTPYTGFDFLYTWNAPTAAAYPTFNAHFEALYIEAYLAQNAGSLG